MPQLPDRQARSSMGTKLRSRLGAYAKSCVPQEPCGPCAGIGIPVLVKVPISGITDKNIPFTCPDPGGGWGFLNRDWWMTFGRQGIGPYVFTCPDSITTAVRNELLAPSVFHSVRKLPGGHFGTLWLTWPPWSVFGTGAWSDRMTLVIDFDNATGLADGRLIYTGPVGVQLCSGNMDLTFTASSGTGFGCLDQYPAVINISVEKVAPCPGTSCSLDPTLIKKTFIFIYPSNAVSACSGLVNDPPTSAVVQSMFTKTGDCLWEAWWSANPYGPLFELSLQHYYFKLEYLGSGNLKAWVYYPGVDDSAPLVGIYEGNFSIADINNPCLRKDLLPTFLNCAPQGEPHPARFSIY